MNQAQTAAYWLIPDRFDPTQGKSSWLEMARQARSLDWQIDIIAAGSSIDFRGYGALAKYVRTVDLPVLFRWVTMLRTFFFGTKLKVRRYRPDLKQRCAPLGLEDKVHVIGSKPSEEDLVKLQAADCCTYTLQDLWEWRVSNILNVLAYLASGKPVILTSLFAHETVANDPGCVVWPPSFESNDVLRAIIDAQSRLEEWRSHIASVRQFSVRSFGRLVHAYTLRTLFLLDPVTDQAIVS